MRHEAVVSTSHLRESNLRAVLAQMWEAGPVTGSDLMSSTGLTRATVHDVCDDLQRRGWIEELENQRLHGDYSKGRPARRYAFRPQAGVIVGIDAGDHRITATVADLLGGDLATHSVALAPGRTSDGARLAAISATALDALRQAGQTAHQVLAVAVGVPAPVDGEGRTVVRTNPFWNRVNPEVAAHLAADHGWTVLLDNDANLAALAEGWLGHGRGLSNFVTLLAGERLGAGVIENGALLRGVRGGAGEMVFLDFVDGVGSADGIASLCRAWALEALRDARDARGARGARGPSSLSAIAPADLTSEAVFQAARDGDHVAAGVIARLGERFARIAAVIGKVFDTELIVLAGAVADSCGPIVDVVRERLNTTYEPPVPRFAASALGESIVCRGAVRRALDHVRADAGNIVLPSAATG